LLNFGAKGEEGGKEKRGKAVFLSLPRSRHQGERGERKEGNYDFLGLKKKKRGGVEKKIVGKHDA